MANRKRIPGYSKYLATSEGNIYSTIKYRKSSDRLMKQGANKDGYKVVKLAIDGGGYKIRFVHRLVALAFIPNNRTDRNVVNHKNGIKTDNRVENLEWCTIQENSIHATRVLGIGRGELSGRAKLTDDDVKNIRACYRPRQISRNSLAEKFGVHKSHIDRILANTSWTHLHSADEAITLIEEIER